MDATRKFRVHQELARFQDGTESKTGKKAQSGRLKSDGKSKIPEIITLISARVPGSLGSAEASGVDEKPLNSSEKQCVKTWFLIGWSPVL